MKIEYVTASERILVDGVERGDRLQVQKDEHGQAVWLDGVEVKAKVYRDGVLIADTTVPPLTKRVVS